MTTRDRMVLMVVLMVAALAAAWMLVVQPKRSQASKLGGQVTSEQNQLTSARSQVAQGEAARNQFANDYTQLVRLGEAVPSDDDVPSLIYQLQGAANATDVVFRSLQVSPSGSSSAPSSGGSQSSSQYPPGVAVGPAGLPVEQFSFVLQGNFFHLAGFFNRLQQFVVAANNQISISGRLLTVNGISFSAGPQGFPQITANVSATTYLAQPLQVGSGGGPSGSAPAPSTPTHSPTSTPGAAAAVTSPIR